VVSEINFEQKYKNSEISSGLKESIGEKLFSK